MEYLDSILQESNKECSVISDSMRLMKKKEFPDNEIVEFAERAVRVLDNCTRSLGAGTQFRYALTEHLGRIRLRLIFHGPRFNPIPEEDDAIENVSEFVSQLFLDDESAFISYKRFPGIVVITMNTAVKPRNARSIKRLAHKARSPLLWAIIMGIVCGLACQHLPDHIRSFLVNGLADPVGSTVLSLIVGVASPVIFLSLITSITSLGSISRLTDLGFKIVWRFIRSTLFIIGVSISVSLLFYNVFGAGTIQFSPDQLVSMLLKLIPTNFVAPFLNNDTPQLVILGLLMGAGLLLLEDRVANLSATLRSLQEWSSSVMHLVYVLTPVIPFISLFKAFADKKESVLLEGWEFIVGVIATLLICCLFKLVKVSLKCKFSIPVLLKKALPMASLAFSTGSENATLSDQIEHSESKLGINRDFSDFWIPMSHAMFKTENHDPSCHTAVSDRQIHRHAHLPVVPRRPDTDGAGAFHRILRHHERLDDPLCGFGASAGIRWAIRHLQGVHDQRRLRWLRVLLHSGTDRGFLCT